MSDLYRLILVGVVAFILGASLGGQWRQENIEGVCNAAGVVVMSGKAYSCLPK